MSEESKHAAQLRHDIDRGKTGDKVDFSDPSVAPLGTDDEASGFPPTSEQVRRARAAERLNKGPAKQRVRDLRSFRWVALFLFGAVVVAILVFIFNVSS